MPWKAPIGSATTPDPRLDPYRDRAAVAWDDQQIAFTFYVHTDYLRSQLGGHLWWKRWSEPREFLMLLGESPSGEMVIDEWCMPGELESELEDWASGRITIWGDTYYRLEWLGEAESIKARDSWYGKHPSGR